MWSHIQNSRPITSSAHPKKALNPNLKEKLRIYNASPVKTRQPTSEEARRHPIKAYTLRLSSRNKASLDHPNLVIKTNDKEHSPDVQGEERNGTRRVYDSIYKSADDTQGDKGKDQVVSFREGRTVKATLSLKELIHESAQMNNNNNDDGVPFGALYKGSTSPNAIKGRSEIIGLYNLKKKSTMSPVQKLERDFDDRYREKVAKCIDKYADSCIDTTEMIAKPPRLIMNNSSEALSHRHSRPHTAFPIDSAEIFTPTKNITIDGFKQKVHTSCSPIHRKSKGSLGSVSNLLGQERVQERIELGKEQMRKLSSSFKELRLPLQEEQYSKYKQLKDNLKLENAVRVPRYQINVRKVIVPKTPTGNTPERKAGAVEAKWNNSALLTRTNDDSAPKGILEIFKLERIIGQGAYAVVRMAIDRRSGENFALKSYSKLKLCDVQRKESVKREIDILQNSDHPNIIKLHRTIDSPTHLHLVLELGGSLSLQTYLKNKPSKKLLESEVKVIFRQLAEGVSYLHKNNIAHRDLKLENILINNDKNVKIIDFGFSLVTPKNKPLNIFCGTPSYMAPELIAKKNYYGHLVDIWALGILLFVLLSGQFPFKAPTNSDLYNKITSGQYQIPDNLSTEVKSLIKRMLRMNPHERPSAQEILTDRWITGTQETQPNLKDFLSSKIEQYKNLQQDL